MFKWSQGPCLDLQVPSWLKLSRTTGGIGTPHCQQLAHGETCYIMHVMIRCIMKILCFSQPICLHPHRVKRLKRKSVQIIFNFSPFFHAFHLASLGSLKSCFFLGPKQLQFSEFSIFPKVGQITWADSYSTGLIDWYLQLWHHTKGFPFRSGYFIKDLKDTNI